MKYRLSNAASEFRQVFLISVKQMQLIHCFIDDKKAELEFLDYLLALDLEPPRTEYLYMGYLQTQHHVGTFQGELRYHREILELPQQRLARSELCLLIHVELGQ
jgi:hypothetical protein